MTRNDLIDLVNRIWIRHPKEPPSVIADRVCKKLTGQQRSAVLIFALPYFIYATSGTTAKHVISPPKRKNKHTTSPSRWDRTGKNWLEVPVYVPLGDEWKPQGNLTADECFSIADRYKANSATLLRRARHFEGLGKEIQKHKVKTVRQLPKNVREQIAEKYHG